MAFDIKTLQQGNKIIGVSSGDDANLQRVEAGRIGGAFAWWLAQKVQKNNWDLNICTGYDSRESSAALREGIMTGFQMFGAHNHDAELATSAAMKMGARMPVYEYDATVMITAGDNLENMNGFRFFTAEGEVSEDDIAKILGYAAKYVFVGEWYETEKTNLMDMYAAHLKQAISSGLRDLGGKLDGMHINIDTSNGAGEFFAGKVLDKLGADVNCSLDQQADLGIKFSFDGDAVELFDSDGNPIPRNETFSVDEDAASQAIRKIIAVAKEK